MPFGVTAYLLYHIILSLSSTFSNFFELFSRLSFEAISAFQQPVYYITLSVACQVLFKIFFKKFFLAVSDKLSQTAFIFYHFPHQKSIWFLIK